MNRLKLNNFISVLTVLYIVGLLMPNSVLASDATQAVSVGDIEIQPSTSTPLTTAIPTTAEKLVTFYNSYGYEVGSRWHIPINLWVSEQPDKIRRLTAKGAQKVLLEKAGVGELTDEQKRRYKIVVDGFIADSESNEQVAITFASDPLRVQYLLSDIGQNSNTDRNGNLQALLVLSHARVSQLLKAQQSNNGWLQFHAVSSKHYGRGVARMIEPIGLSVISDIDDTIKDTGITVADELVLRNTFFDPFKRVACMPELYGELDDAVSFHYVSGAPWQLYSPLVSFMFNGKNDAYPDGSLHMKNVRTNLSTRAAYSDIWKLVSGGSKQVTFEQKLAQITQLITHFPVRQFVLVGDSGERDPEVFAQIRKRFPAHIDRIIIRDLGNTKQNRDERFVDMQLIPGDASATTGCTGVKGLFH